MLNFQPINLNFRDPMTWFAHNHGEIVILVNAFPVPQRLIAGAQQ
jgi:hypothetical protein